MRDFTYETLDGTNYAFMEFNSLNDYYTTMVDNNWVYKHFHESDDFTRDFTYGSSFPTKGEHYNALKHGKASKAMVDGYTKMRSQIENELNINQYYQQGLSCMRTRRFRDEGDEVDINRYLGGADNYWITHKRDRQAKNIRIALNFGLNSNNTETKFAELVAVLATLADILTRLGFATEILGCNFRRYQGDKKLSYTCSSIKFKGSSEKLDIQRILSMGLQGLLRDWEFGIGKQALKYDGTQGYQANMPQELQKRLNINYMVEQQEIKTAEKRIKFFNNIITELTNR
tara:strand:- start:40 stop:900 length:861 start_codon:yes stop_codon:yes gene_type:complete